VLGVAAAAVATAIGYLAPARLALLFGALLLAGCGVGEARLAAIDAPAGRVRDGAWLEAPVHVIAHPRPSPFGASLEVQVAGGRLAGARLLARVPRWVRFPSRAPIGSEVLVSGTLRKLRGGDAEVRNGDREGFDFAAHLRRRGVAGELLLDRVRPTGRRRGGVAGAVDRLREPAEQAVVAGLPAAEAALLRGMVLGQDESISQPVREDWRDSGLAHLLAVSGQNVMLLVALALPALAAAGLGNRARAAVLLALIALYVPLAGAGPSLQRAGVMGAAGIAALAASRPSSRAYALLLAATATLALNPRACGDPGWQLSFSAVAGIAWLAGPLSRTLRSAFAALVPGGIPGGGPFHVGSRGLQVAARGLQVAARGLADGAALTLAATVATAPLLAHHFGSVPLAGLPANLLGLPAVAPAMWLGMVKAALGQGIALGGPLGAASAVAAEALGAPALAAVSYLGALAERFAGLPGGQVGLPLGSALGVALAYAAILAGVASLRRAAGPLAPRAAEAAGRWRRRGRRAG
jgi:competence protein ComEC